MIDLIREIGKIPTIDEIRLKSYKDKSFPSHNTFNKLDNQRERIQKIMEYCQDVPQLQVRLFNTVSYIFKIGRSNSAGRREYELKNQLPEKSRLVHEIATDDPIGIESYWHRRFADKRKTVNGLH